MRQVVVRRQRNCCGQCPVFAGSPLTAFTNSSSFSDCPHTPADTHPPSPYYPPTCSSMHIIPLPKQALLIQVYLTFYLPILLEYIHEKEILIDLAHGLRKVMWTKHGSLRFTPLEGL